MSEDERAARMNRWQGATTYDALGEADLIIEAVFEDMDVKLAVFAELDRVARPGAVLATNTSYLDINRIARATRGPADVLGLHFFSPANIMKLLEVVAGQSTAPDTVATGFELARRLGKTPVRAGVCDGFIGNRILAVHRQAADLMMQDGASPYEIDAAVRAFGYPMGPYQMADLAGGDIGQPPASAAPPRATRRCATCAFPTCCASATGSARRPGAASTCIRTARARASPIPKCWP